MRHEPTDAEALLWRELRAQRLMGLGFRRQLPIGRYIVDFACPEHRLIVELDGIGHNRPAQIIHDERRTAYLEGQGWSVLRFPNPEIKRNVGLVCDHIVRVLQNRGVEFS